MILNMKAAVLVAAMALAACTQGQDGNGAAMEGNGVSIRNLAASDVASPAAGRPRRVEGTLIPTPSDTQSRHYLLRGRQAIGGTIVAILREERGDKVAYARTEIDCARRLFHVVGVAPTRAQVEVAVAHDGPLRPIEGLPLRQELAAFICGRSNTPLTPA